MLKSTAQAEAKIDALAKSLAARLSMATTKQQGAEWPMLAVGTAALIRIASASISEDSLGNQHAAACPHIADVAYSNSAVDASDVKVVSVICAELSKMGIKAAVRGAASLNEAALNSAADFAIDSLQWPNSGV